MFFFCEGDVGIESVYGCLRQLCLDERESAGIPSANHSLIVCKFPLIWLDGLACLGCVFAYVPSKATWRVSVLLTPL